MGKSNPAKLSFNGGVQSPLLRGMVNAPKGDSSFQASNNMIPMKYGPIARRGPTEFIYKSKDNTADQARSKLVPFTYNDTDSYIIEFSYERSGGIVVYKNRSIVFESESTLNQEITGIPAVVSPADIVISVDGDGTDYLVGSEVVITGLTEAVYLNDSPTTVTANSANTVSVSRAQHLTAETSSSGTLKQVFKLTVPYTSDDMFASDGTFLLDVVQYNDVMYIAHPDYQTRILTRAGDDDWSITLMDLVGGPSLPDNLEKNNKLYLSRFFDVAGIDDYTYAIVESKTAESKEVGVFRDMFVPSDVQLVDDRGLTTVATDAKETWLGTSTEGGRLLSIFVPQYVSSDDQPKDHRWHHLKIVKYISASEVWVERKKTERDWSSNKKVTYTSNSLGADMRPDQWALGAFSVSTGFPSALEIHDGRLCAGNTATEPTTVHFSQIGGFDTTSSTWATVDPDGQVYDDHGFNVAIGGGNQSPIQWISSSSDGVLVGSYNSEGLIGANDTSNGFVPGGVSYRKTSSVGSKSIQPIMIDQSTLFVSRTGRRIHEMTYDLASTGQKSPDLTSLAEHVTLTGVIDFAWQREPRDTLWMVLADGKLVGFTFDKNNDITAWHQHELGGDGVRIRSVASIPSPDGLSDDLWLAVDRIKAYGDMVLTVYDRTIEVLNEVHESTDNLLTSAHLDMKIELATSEKTGELDGVTNRIDTDASHGFSENDIIFIKNVDFKVPELFNNTGLTDAQKAFDQSASTLNNNYFRVATPIDSRYFGLKSLTGTAISITDLVDVANTGSSERDCIVQPTENTFSGASIMANQTVKAYIDGRPMVDQYISSDNLSTVGATSAVAGTGYYANMTLGYSYPSFVELHNLEGNPQGGLDQGKTKKINKVMVRILNSLGLKYGDSASTLLEEDFDEQGSPSEYRDLKSADYILDWDGDFEQSGTIRLQGDGPYPLQIQAVIADMDTKGYSSNR